MGLRKFAKTESEEVIQNHICTECDCQFIEVYDAPKGYSKQVKQECLKMYFNGMGFRVIEQVKGVHHNNKKPFLEAALNQREDDSLPIAASQ